MSKRPCRPVCSSAIESLEARRHLSMTIKFDYTYDTSGFFTADRRSAVQAAADAITSQLNDVFAAITPSGGNTWSVHFGNPSGSDAVAVANPTVPAGTILVYVGAKQKAANVLADAGPAGWGLSGTDAWRDSIMTRGEAPSPSGFDFAPTVAYISFATGYDWFAGVSARSIGSSQYDLYTVAQHELGHVLGIGTSQAWFGQVEAHKFKGPKSVAIYGGPVPTQANVLATPDQHFDFSARLDYRQPTMSPATGSGFRYSYTRLDFTALDDIGYDVTPQPVPVFKGGISGSAYDDLNGDGFRQSNEPAYVTRVFLDVNKNGTLDADEPNQMTGANGKYTFSNLLVGAYRVAQVNPDNGYRLLKPLVGYIDTNVEPNVNTAVQAFAYVKPAASATLSGYAFDDTNRNGQYDAGENKTGGKIIFLDLDNDRVLDSNEQKITTAADGGFSFSGLAAGGYHVRRVFPSGFTYSTVPIDVTLTAGQALAGLGIGSRSAATPPPMNTASLAGIAFNDVNKNGKYDSGDTLAPGKAIWLDLDDDGVKDSNEPSVVTGNDGGFLFKTLAAGKYHVRRVFSPGYAESTPAAYVTLASGQTAAGVLIGSKVK